MKGSGHVAGVRSNDATRGFRSLLRPIAQEVSVTCLSSVSGWTKWSGYNVAAPIILRNAPSGTHEPLMVQISLSECKLEGQKNPCFAFYVRRPTVSAASQGQCRSRHSTEAKQG